MVVLALSGPVLASQGMVMQILRRSVSALLRVLARSGSADVQTSRQRANAANFAYEAHAYEGRRRRQKAFASRNSAIIPKGDIDLRRPDRHRTDKSAILLLYKARGGTRGTALDALIGQEATHEIAARVAQEQVVGALRMSDGLMMMIRWVDVTDGKYEKGYGRVRYENSMFYYCIFYKTVPRLTPHRMEVFSFELLVVRFPEIAQASSSLLGCYNHHHHKNCTVP